jgi:hypothetical protein
MNTSSPNNLDNTHLLKLINVYAKQQTEETYAAVINELMEGNAYLLMPSVGSNHPKKQWRNMDEGESLDLTSVFKVDGLHVLGAFTSEETLLQWAQKETNYSAMPSREVIDLCMANQIQRIVIDSDQPTMFVMQRNTDHIETETIQEETNVLVGTPSNPIEDELLQRLRSALSKVSVVQEAYQYLMSRGKETSLVLAFKLDAYNDNSRKACQYAVEDALQDETIEQGLQLFYLQDESWYETAKGVENSLVYKK